MEKPELVCLGGFCSDFIIGTRDYITLNPFALDRELNQSTNLPVFSGLPPVFGLAFKNANFNPLQPFPKVHQITANVLEKINLKIFPKQMMIYTIKPKRGDR